MTITTAHHIDRMPLGAPRPEPGLTFIGPGGFTHEIVKVRAGIVYIRGEFTDRKAWGHVATWRRQLADGVIRLAPRVVCSWCKKVIREGTRPTSHGVCSDCKGVVDARAGGSRAHGGPGSASLVRMPHDGGS